MTAEELAKLLNGREYRSEIDDAEAEAAREAGLVVVFGYSDDLMEFVGAIFDEVDAYDGGHALVRGSSVRPNYNVTWEDPGVIEALWCEEEPYSWTFRTSIPHVTFDIMDEGRKYCRGIVFRLSDVKTSGQSVEEHHANLVRLIGSSGPIVLTDAERATLRWLFERMLEDKDE